MPLISTCLARLGSRHSLIFDPHRREIHYGSLGLMCQSRAEMVLGIQDRSGNKAYLPFCRESEADRFHLVDQDQTMTSLTYVAHSLAHGVKVTARFVAPFWPEDENISLLPAYLLDLRVENMDRVRWSGAKTPRSKRKGVLRFGLRVPEARIRKQGDGLSLRYTVNVGQEIKTGEGGQEQDYSPVTRNVPVTGTAQDRLVPLQGGWRVRNGMLELPYDFSKTDCIEGCLALASYCGDALFERRGKPMKLKYADKWSSVEAVVEKTRKTHHMLRRKSARFDSLWTESSLPVAVQDLSALSFQSYLMNTLWCSGQDPKEWFSVWEGSCWFNSTVDVTYNEAMLYFSCWPRLLELIFEQWSGHANTAEDDQKRRGIISDDERFGVGEEEFAFPGRIMQHDMGAGWTANGMSYHHMMPVEENSNWLLLLYAHGRWWNRPDLYTRYHALNRDLVDYLLWTDSTGTGFPDRGTANTIDDATPAVQYGRDNVYLGIKRLAALHAAGRMFTEAGDETYARKCRKEVRRAVTSLNRGWLGDHWGVCLDKSAKGLVDCWTKKPLPYRELPGWDAYSLYTTNGLVYLMMIEDLPEGLSPDRLRQDVVSATRASMTRYGCGHSSLDQDNMWVSMNVWRDCAAGYLGVNMLTNSERYWNQQLYANGAGAEKPNCFTETSLTNNLVWYPRNTAIFGLTLSSAGIQCGPDRTATVSPLDAGTWPLLPFCDWKKNRLYFAECRDEGGTLQVEIVER